MPLRGIRGAVQADANSAEAIERATRHMIEEIQRANGLNLPDVAAAFFTVTDDLDAAFPAAGARALGWTDVPMLCHREIPVPGSLERVVRVLLLVNSRTSAQSIKHVYLGAAQCLRPDLAADAAPKRKRPGGATKKFRARLLGKSLSPERGSMTSSEGEQP